MTADRQAGKEAAMKKSTWLSYEIRTVEGLLSVTVTEEEYEKVPPDLKGPYHDYYVPESNPDEYLMSRNSHLKRKSGSFFDLKRIRGGILPAESSQRHEKTRFPQQKPCFFIERRSCHHVKNVV